jgi:hypothetical protein
VSVAAAARAGRALAAPRFAAARLALAAAATANARRAASPAAAAAAATANARRAISPAACAAAADVSPSVTRAVAPARVTLPLLPARALVAPLLSCERVRAGVAAAAGPNAALAHSSSAVDRRHADGLVAGYR